MNKRNSLNKQRIQFDFINKKIVGVISGFMILITIVMLFARTASTAPSQYTFPAQTVTQWAPYGEWGLTNSSYSGNPFDIAATATFVHSGTGETRTTAMFYDENNSWKFRFAGTQLGEWTFTTSSNDPELDGQSGLVTVQPNPGVPGFVTNFGSKWGRTGTNEVFVPQFVIAAGPQYYYNNAAQMDADIQTFIVEHGFNGFHVPVFCRWAELDRSRCNANGSSDPDPHTFESLEQLITKVHAAGGVVHLWAWTDNADRGNPNTLSGGINGAADKRIQRYIAARLGPIPGWTMGYGFDLQEWTNESQLTEWHDFMQAEMGWSHYLGARSEKNRLTQLSESLEYSGYEQHKPNYDMYVQTIETRPNKPSFSEDRFRIRNQGRSKDYNMEETRRGLWHSAMAGGVANIWGNLVGALDANDGLIPSNPYSNPEWIKTYSLFFEDRFLADMSRCNGLSSGSCLKVSANSHYVFYQEDTAAIQIDLSGMAGTQNGIAVDAKNPYVEINIGALNAANQTWNAPYASDWAIAVGDFGTVVQPPAPTNTPVPPQPTNTAVSPTATNEPPQPTNTPIPPTATNVPPLPTVTAVPPIPTSQPPSPPTSCSNKTILFVSQTNPATPEDQLIIDHLQTLGHTIEVIDQRNVQVSDSNGKDLLLISSSVSARQLTSLFRDVNVPVMTWEVMLFGNMGFTEAGRRNYGYLNSQTDVNIVNSTHPIADNLFGTVAMLNAPSKFYWGTPLDSATEIAMNSNGSKSLIFVYEQGAQMAELIAPARRVAFNNGNAFEFTAQGWQLFDAAVSWAVGCN